GRALRHPHLRRRGSRDAGSRRRAHGPQHLRRDLRQQHTPQHLLGRVTSAFNVLNVATAPIVGTISGL
ncbi:MAG: hypothetical protein AVDCRST_MAG75-2800, partial [uncultured Propionibacteriaceae bacterium]